MQEQLPGYGFCRLAAHPRDDERMQGHRWVAAVSHVATASNCWLCDGSRGQSSALSSEQDRPDSAEDVFWPQKKCCQYERSCRPSTQK